MELFSALLSLNFQLYYDSLFFCCRKSEIAINFGAHVRTTLLLVTIENGAGAEQETGVFFAAAVLLEFMIRYHKNLLIFIARSTTTHLWQSWKDFSHLKTSRWKLNKLFIDHTISNIYCATESFIAKHKRTRGEVEEEAATTRLIIELDGAVMVWRWWNMAWKNTSEVFMEMMMEKKAW